MGSLTSGDCLFHVVRGITVSRVLYCSPVPWGFAGAQELEALEGIIRMLLRQRTDLVSPHLSLCDKAEASLFAYILYIVSFVCHVLYKLLPRIKHSRYSMRPRSHNLSHKIMFLCQDPTQIITCYNYVEARHVQCCACARLLALLHILTYLLLSALFC